VAVRNDKLHFQRGYIRMAFLRYLTTAFVDFFGITKPSLGEGDRAAKYIAFLLISVLVLAAAALLIVLHSKLS
jgi:hypothetical protein